MRRTVSIAATGILLICGVQLQAQQIQKKSPSGQGIVAAQHSEIMQTPLQYTIEHDGETDKTKWRRTISKLDLYDHSPDDSIDVIKALKTKLKTLTREELLPASRPGASRAVTPQLGTNFTANQTAFSTPPDNAMAISNGGRIVTSDNQTIEYYNQNGTAILTDEFHEDFFNDPNLNASIFDPRVIYDSDADRFIFVILHGSNSSNTRVLTCFSQTNNPQDGWNVYYLTGNPRNDNSWLDYPQIAVSNNELYISGNLFTNNFSFNQSVVYQIQKSAGYSGGTLNWQLWDNIVDGQGFQPFSLVPLSYGQQGNYGPGVYFTSSRPGGSDRIFLYDLTDDLTASNEQLLSYTVNVPDYELAGDALQQGTSNQLDNGDCRMEHGFYLNGVAHTVHAAEFQNGYNGIRYYRIPVTNLTGVESASYGETNFDVSYPSIASFADNDLSPSVMIGFLRSGSSIFPEQRVVNCDFNMDFGSSTQVKAGQTFVNILNSSLTERWGDYSDMQRKHNANPPEVWLSGCFGSNSPVNNTYNTQIAEIKGVIENPPAPIAEFSADTTVGYPPFTVFFTDSSENNPTSWSWQFPGGTPASSALQNPVVVYIDSGLFDVSLAVSNLWGNDSINKVGYIHILSTDTGQPVDTIDTATFIREIPTGSFNMYPNPVKTYELVNFDIEVLSAARIQATIFDINGREVRVVLDDWLKPGMHRLSFNKLALPPGNYVVRIQSDNQTLRNEKLIVH